MQQVRNLSQTALRHCLTRERSLGLETQAYLKASNLRDRGEDNVAYAMEDMERSPKSSWKAARDRLLGTTIFGWKRIASTRATNRDEPLKPRLKCKRGTHFFNLTKGILGAQRSALKTFSWISVTLGIERFRCRLESSQPSLLGRREIKS